MIDIPKGEKSWLRCFDRNGQEKYLVTSDKSREHYFLYDISKGFLNRIAKARTPVKFEKEMKL